MSPPAPSRLLTRLEAEIARSRDPAERACLQAERAGLLARQGQLGPARAALSQLQRVSAGRAQAALSGWMALAEGLIEHYEHLGASAHDRIRRAHALSGAAELAPLRALSAAWLAHMHYIGGDMTQMARHLREALDLAAPDHHAARSRATLVAAEAYHHAGRLDLAQAWYARSRTHASLDGDQAHQAALMHNHAWLRASQLRFDALFDGAAPNAQALLAADASANLDLAVGIASLDALVPMLRAQMLTLAGRYDEALALFERYFDGAMHQGLAGQRAPLLADWAWCAWQQRQPDQALRDAEAASAALDDCELDDRALAQARLAQVWDGLGRGDAARLCRQCAERDRQAHRAAQQRLAALLDDALAGIDVVRA